jgi:lipopolysaccharide biosynthesis glycosyltransferase
MNIYTGYIYLWYDTKAKLFYLGGHKGKVEDSYVCSNKMMLNAYRKRPETFKFKILEYITGDNSMLREAEQRWLNMINDEELYWTPNIYNNTVRYYNQKKHSSGGNGSANKGNSNIGGHNKGKKHPHSEETKLLMSQKKKEYWARKRLGDSVSTLSQGAFESSR